jgi:hypothetical protein
MKFMPLERFNYLCQRLWSKDERKSNEKNMHYLRIYTNLVLADKLLSKKNHLESFKYLELALQFTKDFPFPKEEHYVKNIQRLVKEVISQEKEICQRFKRAQKTEISHIKVKLQLAQNLCVLRILKN